MDNATVDAVRNAHLRTSVAPSKVNLSEVINMDILNSHVENGVINKKYNDDKSLAIYKYGKITGSVYPWDSTNILTRGLIVGTSTNEVVARGFNKFFSSGQYDYFFDIDIDVNQKAITMPKEDGSLGIAYYHNGKWGIATPLSFYSDQAIHATEMFNKMYGNVEPPQDGTTMLFEIISPENRIVTNYHGQDKLVLVGGADKYGKWVNPENIDFDGERVSTTSMRVQDILDYPDPENTQEGFVFYTEDGLLVKHKFDSYLFLHKAKYSITPIAVWESLYSGKYFDSVGRIPDEFQSDFTSIGEELIHKKDEIVYEVESYAKDVPQDASRKDQVMWIRENVPKKFRGMVINSALDDNSYLDSVWKMIRPKNNRI